MILVRADANENIGIGHIMRCLTVAHSFKKKGEKVTFVTADHRADGLIHQNGFSNICLDSKWTDMNEEIDSLKILIKKEKPSILLIDSYYVTEEYLSSMSACVKTAYFDDLNKATWNVDILINYNVFSFIFDYAVYEKTRTKLLLGPRYAPLREEFNNCPKHEIKTVSSVLVSAGGTDPVRITEKLIKEMCHEYPAIIFHFIIGALNPRLDYVKTLAKNQKNAVLHIDEKHMYDLMRKCDIAISAAGTTLYELCATGIPTITYTMANNQLLAAAEFDKQGIMINAGDCRDSVDFVCRIEEGIDKLFNNIELRKHLSRKMQNLVDGKGAYRLCQELICPSIDKCEPSIY